MPETSTSSEDFSTLAVSIPPLPSYPVQATHYIYLRRNAPKIATPDDSRSLYLANVPVDSTEAHFRALFSSLVGAGRFESIAFEQDRKSAKISHEPAQAERLARHHKKRKREDEEIQHQKEEAAAELPDTWTRELHRSGSSAVALLADEKSVDLVLKAVIKLKKTKKYPVWGEGVKGVPALGAQWLKTHNKLSYPGNDVVQAVVDAYFTVFNRKEEEAQQLAKRLRNEPDEDGFVMVTRGGRSAPARRDEAEEAKQKMLDREQKKKDETQNFYRFQLREKRKAEQMNLLKKFDEDRKKVMAMKEKRGKFRPEA
ncbi:ribosomal RNA-processing protein 7-domain-containing protein [Xylaria bambusicola]|uniref:ribosomal RNA-processing protein 7-domain-containing protein n=1 Tax=Xylaria bambusicola TaxID=326684 RepID=UPI002008904E|nr:ribosomal RNA-processing protein 7-domain-containing protein [Xylaria bambusicola]KAI0528257.1 ribosomal RNA-processing protein 7-domain-containing protein [Xylaria bambusicola]